jgi:DHA3 family macrolide efflux protein-like MFS transporter
LASLLSGRFQLWHLYAVAWVQGTFATAQQSARDASTTMLIPEAQRERANAILQMSFPLAGAIGPALTGVLYPLAGLNGVLVIDLLTFVVAAAAVAFVRIPHPQETPEGRAARGSVWNEMRGALRFLAARPALLGLVLHAIAVNFLLNGPLELSVPYLMAATGSEALTGALAGIMSLGGFVGAAIVALWGGTRPRIHTYAVSLICAGLVFLAFGASRTPWLLGLSLFCLILPLPIMGTMYNSILQIKTPPDMQGRVFGLTAQTGFLGATASFLLVGPLVDRILAPAVHKPGWSLVAPLVGRGPASGIGLLQMVTGLLLVSITSVVYALPAVRCLEETLPDYEAVARSG